MIDWGVDKRRCFRPTPALSLDLISKNTDLIGSLEKNTHHHAGMRMITEVSKPKAPFDLAPLFFGTQGSLGVITELILRVVEVSRPTAKILVAFPSVKEVSQFASELQSLNPLRMDFYDSRIFNLPQISERLDFCQDLNHDRFFLYLEFDDSSLKNKRTLKKISNLTKSRYKIFSHSPKATCQFVKIAKLLDFYQNNPTKPERVIIADNIYLPPQRIADFIHDLSELEQLFEQEIPLFGSLSTNLYSVRPEFDLSFVTDRKQLLRFLQHYGKLVEKHNGNFAGGGGEGRVQAIIFNQTLPTNVKNLYHDIKYIFDPNNILNPKIKQSATLADVVRFLRTSPQIGIIRKD